MTLPAHVDGLRAPDKIIGFDEASKLPVYMIRLGWRTFERVRQLASTNFGPTWHAVSWQWADHVLIATTRPEWFAEVEEQIKMTQAGRL